MILAGFQSVPIIRRACVRTLLGLLLFQTQTGWAFEKRIMPQRVSQAEWLDAHLAAKTVNLAQADLAGLDARSFVAARLDQGSSQTIRTGLVLLQFTNQPQICCLRVDGGAELAAVSVLRSRDDVRFAELDVIQTRCSSCNDPYYSKQWHHAVLGSSNAWNYGMAQSAVCVAIVDSPFQMDHPDMAANTLSGWDVVSNQAVTSSAGIAHSTLCAGLVGAVPNNGVGVAGVANCRVLPIAITGATSEMCQAVYWAADHGVRVVNISWTGADSDALNAAGGYLKTHARGLLVMSGGNGAGYLDYPNQPDIWCVSMTDAADNPRSKYGNSIDFAAPGFAMFSTSVQGGYSDDSGTSYAAPIVAGVMARLMTINPMLEPDDILDILKATAVDLGNPGWDMWYGWGRIDFGAAAAAAYSRLPRLSISEWEKTMGVTFSTGLNAGAPCQLWRTPSLTRPLWEIVPSAVITTNAGQLYFTDPSPYREAGYYRLSMP